MNYDLMQTTLQKLTLLWSRTTKKSEVNFLQGGIIHQCLIEIPL
jgi:hypothetical protein